MEFVKAIDTSEIPANKMVMVVLGGREILLANVDGTYHAIANRCTHMGGNLSKGVLNGSVVTCPRHGSQFDVETGKLVGQGRIAFVKVHPRDEESYPVKVEGTSVLVGLP
jgi:3-phenylpropionate/trans-cinnamate dioxygenase ferredoxin subunit